MPHNFSDLFESFNQMNILVIGDVMVDSYIKGNVERISPEAPVPIVSITHQEDKLGGAANVALNIKSLGANPILCSVIGQDLPGSTFSRLLASNELTTSGILTDKSRQTTVKTRIQNNAHHLIRLDHEDASEINTGIEKALIEHIKKLFDTNHINAIIFEDYDKGVITPNVIKTTIELANIAGIPVLTDPKKRNFDHYQNISLLKPNLKEFKEALKLNNDELTNDNLLLKAKSFIAERNLKCLMITMAEKGVMIVTPDEHHFIPAQVREIADVSGAGDTVISVAALCLTANYPPEAIAQISNMAGGLVCEHPNIIAIDKEKLKRECINKLA